MTRRGLRFALFVGLLAALAVPGTAAAEELTLTVVGSSVVTGTYGFLGGQSLECGPNEICEIEIPRLCPFLQTCPPATPQPQTVELTASAPPAEWVYVEWSGACSSSGAGTTCSLLMDQDRSATATYRHQPGRIVFTSQTGAGYELSVMNADGTGETRLMNNISSSAEAAWSPDGRRIAFRGNNGSGDQIYVMNADGSAATQLTTSTNLNHSPSWSPDGQRIAFSGFQPGTSEIYVMNTDGSVQTRLTNSGAQPTWSPDGQRIAFVSTRDGNSEIYVMNADGSGQTPLTSNGVSDSIPDWSPDGQRIAFVQEGDIYVMNANGSNSTLLTDTASNYSPDWSPDGQQILFSSDRSMFANHLYVMNADGSGVTRLRVGGDFREPSWTSASVRSQLFVAKAGSGSGTVSSSPGIDCGADCWELYEPGTQVTLSAVAAGGSIFVGWSDGCSGTQPTCVVTMDTSKRVTATFFLLPVSQGPAPQGACTHTGTDGNDLIFGTPGNDVICAGRGNDVVRGGGGNDVIRLGPGSDKGYGGAGKDRIFGDAGRDRLVGGPGRDRLDGGRGRDVCIGRGDIKRRCP